MAMLTSLIIITRVTAGTVHTGIGSVVCILMSIVISQVVVLNALAAYTSLQVVSIHASTMLFQKLTRTTENPSKPQEIYQTPIKVF